MQLIQFEGRTVAVIAPEDLEQLERDLANVRELWRIANENANARLAETEKWKGIQQEACAQRDALRRALEAAMEDAYAGYLAMPDGQVTEMRDDTRLDPMMRYECKRLLECRAVLASHKS